MRAALLSVSDWIASIFKIGYLPLAPGTWASGVALGIWYVLPDIQPLTYVLILLNLFLLGIITATIVSERENDSDPKHVVIDEWVGMWIALMLVPKVWSWMLISFFLFRLFDIVKVFPAGRMEKLRGGWGIMLDDVVAGVYAFVVIMVARPLIP